MAFLARALLLLCGLQGTVLSLRGHCTDTQCYALFVGQKDFRGAQKSCRNSDGDLLLFLDAEAQGHLLAGLSGSYWFGTAGGAPNCISCTVWMGGNLTIEKRPCGDKLAGYICQYPNADPCGAIHPVAADAKVTYAAPMSFEVNATSLHFPRGTVAVEAETGAFHPLAKYLCFESSWLKAPWNCEVMGGGCEERCNSTTSSCECSERTVLHANLITCSENPCDRCAHLCDAATQKCACRAGYALGPDGKNCADVDECEQPDVCTSEGKECVNTRGGYECRCKDGFEEEKEEGGEGACVDVSICDKCEHMKCDKSDGVYACACREGFRVSPLDPTKCEMSCDRQDCLANCIPNPDLEEKDMHQCFCPDGYIQDIRNNTAYCTDIDECKNRKQCEHTCENLFGSFACSCNEGYDLFDEYMCVPPDGEGWRPADPTPAPPRAASMPTYVKAGSVLGITVFLLLCLLLLYLLVRNLAKRCGSLELSSLKGPDVDIFYGGFVCSCRKGFTLVDEVFCDRNEDEDEEAVGSGEAATTPSAPTVTPHEVAPTRQPSAVTVGGLVAIIVCCVLVVVVVVFLSQHILFSGILSVHVQQHCGARQLECLSWPEDPQDLEWFYERLVSKILKDAEVKTLDKGAPKPDIPPG